MSWLINTSQQDKYLSVLSSSISNDNLFQRLKSIPSFFEVVGVADSHYARECYNHVIKNTKVIVNMEKFLKNDTVGTPMMSACKFKEKNIGQDTIRYVDTVARLQEEFGDLNGKTIVEIGSNVGGLCFCVTSQWPDFKEYRLVDFREAQSVAMKYLKLLAVDMSKINDNYSLDNNGATDLLIAEYSITEQDDASIKEFYDVFIQHTANFFIRSNISDSARYQNFLNLLNQDFNLTVEDEFPKHRRPNRIICGRKE